MPKGYPKSAYPDQYGETSEELPPLSVEQVLIEIQQAQAKKDSAETLRTIGDLLERLTPTDRETLLGTPSVQNLVESARQKAAKEGKPGSTICDSKGRVLERVEWTYDALKEEFGEVEWTPMQTRWLTWNGIQVWVQQGVPIKTPPQFRDLAMEAWQKEVNANDEYAAIMLKNFGRDSTIMTGAGDLVWSGRVQN